MNYVIPIIIIMGIALIFWLFKHKTVYVPQNRVVYTHVPERVVYTPYYFPRRYPHHVGRGWHGRRRRYHS